MCDSCGRPLSYDTDGPAILFCPTCGFEVYDPPADKAASLRLEPTRVVRLVINDTDLHFVTFSDAPLAELTLGELQPYPALDAAVWLDGVCSK